MSERYNPFLLQGYVDAKTFCDRERELAFLKEAMANQRNVTIISLRRLGKTALIRHFFNSQRRFIPVFIDLYRTTDQAEMVRRIVEESLKQVGKPTRPFLKEVAQAIRSLEFSFSMDALTGAPEWGAKLRPGQLGSIALDELFQYLESRKKPVVIALDEFQQIVTYPEQNTEAMLREQVQKLRNVQFIFSGSDRRMMQAIFADGKRPFFQATEPLYLETIPDDAYTDFIRSHFKAGGKRIEETLVRSGLEWCRTHTYYVQYLFNRLFGISKSSYDPADLAEAQSSILSERAPEYITLKRLLSTNQAALLTAIAKEGWVSSPLAMEFIRNHRLSAVSTVNQSLNVLLDKEILHQEPKGYRVTDVFLGHWLAGG